MVIFCQKIVQNFGAASVLSPVCENSLHHLQRELSWVMVRTRALCGNGVPDVVELHIVHPSHNGALIESGMTSDFSGAPAFPKNKSGRFQTETRKMRIGGIWHVHTVRGGDAKVLNHYM
jgi:hypothetical protein